MNPSKIAPSMMCVDISKIEESIRIFEQNGIDYLHIDIMDGNFVPNYALGTDFCEKLRQITDIPLDIHLMITEPERKFKWFQPREGEYVSVHFESTVHFQRVLAEIRDYGAKPMAAINPATPIACLENILDDIDAVLVMTVNPGYAGQKLVPKTIEKIRALREYLDAKGYENIEIEVDGNVSIENAAKMKKAGANIFVGGSSSIFYPSRSLSENIALLRKSVM